VSELDCTKLVRILQLPSRTRHGFVSIREITQVDRDEPLGSPGSVVLSRSVSCIPIHFTCQAKVGRGSTSAARRNDVVRLLNLAVNKGLLQSLDMETGFAAKFPPDSVRVCFPLSCMI
jgi:hypothetical protein